MQKPVWENPRLWELCQRHGATISRHEKITQLAILDLYDELLAFIKYEKVLHRLPEQKVEESSNE